MMFFHFAQLQMDFMNNLQQQMDMLIYPEVLPDNGSSEGSSDEDTVSEWFITNSDSFEGSN